MIGFPDMLVAPAEEAGMKVPPDTDKFDRNEYPHFQVYLNLQLGQSMPNPTSHWSNAKLVSSIPDDKIMTITIGELLEMGLEVGFPIP